MNRITCRVAVSSTLIMQSWGGYLSASESSARPSKEQAARPNIVWIVSEDNSAEFMRLFQEKMGHTMLSIAVDQEVAVTWHG